MSLLSSDKAPSKSSIQTLYHGQNNFETGEKSKDETIILSSHFVLERGKKQDYSKVGRSV